MKKHLRTVSFLLILFCVLPVLPAAAAEDIQSDDASFTHILLIGRDGSEHETARSDCMILCSFSEDTEDIVFTSFLRDLYVPIPGFRDNRLNAAYALGGASLLWDTVEQTFGVSVDGCIEVDFSSFPKIIDALGGVSLELRQDEAEVINREIPGSLTEGTHLLSGEQALAYSRIRKLDSDGDFSRSLRQRKLLASLLERYQEADLLTVLSAVADTLPLITTSFSRRDILRLSIRLFPLLKNPRISGQRFPSDGTYQYETIRGMNVLTADLDMLRSLLQQSFTASAKADD